MKNIYHKDMRWLAHIRPKLLKMAQKSSFVKLSLFVIIMLLLSNASMISYYQYTATKTTFVLSKTFNEFRDGTSSSETENDEVKMPVEYLDRRKKNILGDARPEDGNDLLLGTRKLYPDDRFRREEYVSTKKTEIGKVTVAEDTDQVKMEDVIVDQMIANLNMSNVSLFFPPDYWNTSLYTLKRQLGKEARDNAEHLSCYKDKTKSDSLPNWQKVGRHIRRFSYYDPDDPALMNLLVDMATLDITKTEENNGGTQLKLELMFSNGGRALMKPMRLAREVESNPNVYVFGTVERHIAEIAAFQLDKVLGFYRVPPIVGRLINITQLQPLMPESVRSTVHISPAGNKCFYGKCSYYCSNLFPFCGNPDMIEAAIISHFPSSTIAHRVAWYQPWRRSYNAFRKARWETHNDYCDHVRNSSPFNNSKLLLDMVDAHTFDFLTGNKDRHSFTSFSEWNNYSFPILFDNGRGFGQANYDAMSILAPLRQCCIIRKSTFLKYVKLYTGPDRLSDIMRQALQDDPVAPVLIPGHLNALDRRIVKILRAVAECLQKIPTEKVIISDQF